MNIARAITANTRFYIHLLNHRLNQHLKKKTGVENSVIYNDTDSVAADTMIRTSQGCLEIQKLFDMLPGTTTIRGENDVVKTLNTKILTPSMSKNKEVQMKPIKHIMKHKVMKKMYKVTVDDKSVVVTQDHSIIVSRNNVLTDVKPQDILNTDKIIYINNI